MRTDTGCSGLVRGTLKCLLLMGVVETTEVCRCWESFFLKQELFFLTQLVLKFLLEEFNFELRLIKHLVMLRHHFQFLNFLFIKFFLIL